MSTRPRSARNELVQSFASRRFEIKRRLGEGSMGAVYLAHDRERGVDVALKTLRRADPVGIYGFKREFRALADVVHPNLVALYDLFQEGDLWYFTMEHVEGVDFITYVHGERAATEWKTPQSTPDPTDLFRTGETIDAPQPRGLELLFPSPLRDEEKLRSVMIQITHALLAIHAAGKLHRDLKSDNVLVTSEGHAKVLDFGIVIDRALGPHATLELGVMGTPAYMSPEQAAGGPVDLATDWYALGVMLYEALTGSVPFDGGYLEVMNQKQRQDPPPPSSLVSGVPDDLDQLCVQLLRREPQARPDGLGVLRALEQRRPPSIRPTAGGTTSSVPVEGDVPFVGREEELAALRRHLAATDRGRLVVTLVQGPSGIGKTTLVDRFVRAERQSGHAIVLRGRCYERETVPFKAWDSLVDSLSRYLRRLSSAEAAELLPRDILALAQLFPVLKRAEVVAGARRRGGLPQDRAELRRRAFAALKELLCRLADRSPLVLFIDDLQWGDADSAQLLADLIHGRDVPAMMLLLTHRSDEAGPSACSRVVLDAREGEDADVHVLDLAPLREAESVELARRLLGNGPSVAAVSIGVESQGSPHLLTELVRHLQSGARGGTASPDTERGAVSFERALSKRVSELSAGARTLLELLAVAGRPVTEESLSLVSSFDIDLQQAVTELRGAKLVRGVGTHARRAIEIYHDRIRDAVVHALAPAQLVLWHKRLATTLEATGSEDLEAIVEHLLGAGDMRRAQVYAIRAAAQAVDALAFDKAARLFAIAVRNQGVQGSSAELLGRWADALVNAGYPRQAADVCFAAARAASTTAESEALRRKAGLQLLISGHEDEALEVLGGTLDKLGIRLPNDAEEMRSELSTLRAFIAEAGFELRAREDAIAPQELEQNDMMWALTYAMAQYDPDRALPLLARHVLAALELGDPARAVRALCLYHNTLELPRTDAAEPAAPALAQAERLASALESPDAQARIELAHGLDALRTGQLRPALRAIARAEELFRTRCPGAGSEMRMCRTAMGYVFVSFMQLERLGSIAQWAEEAEEHEDLLAFTRLRVLGTLAGLVADRKDHVARELARAKARWGRDRFDLAAALLLMSESMLALYRGDAEAGGRLLQESERFFASVLSVMPLLRANALSLRARLSLAFGADVDAACVAAEQDARELATLQLPGFDQQVRAIRASAALRRSDRDTALALLAAVVAERDEHLDAGVVLAVAERAQGLLQGGEDGRERVLRAEAALRQHGVVDASAFSRLFVPGLPR